MKKSIEIGTGVQIDLMKLMVSRLLVQATSGAGKSWLLRRLLEQSHGMCQQIVIDPEGEFSTLREQFDYVLAAKQGGDTLADVRTAKLLAERLLELGVSAIIDIYELSPTQRVQFVRYFLEALVDAPKHLWHPVLVVLDEAHAFAPESGSGQAESLDAVKALCTRGRKRGFCAVLATQRLPSLSKDAAAMCANKLIGRASLDTDIKRSGAELGMDAKEATKQIRDLRDGEFYAFGPAISSRHVTKVKVGPVTTTHPQAGTQLAARVPPPTDKVKALLPKLSDLPAEAADRERTTAEMKKAIIEKDRRIKELERGAENSSRNVSEKIRDVPALTDADRALIEKLADRITTAVARAEDKFQTAEKDVRIDVERAVGEYLDAIRTAARELVDGVDESLDKASVKKLLEKLHGLAVPSPKLQVQTPRPQVAAPRPTSAATPRQQPSVSAGDIKLGKCERAILTVLSQQPDGCESGKLTLLAGYAWSGTFSNALGALRTAGLIIGANTATMQITEAGRAYGPFDELPTGSALATYWLTSPRFGKAERLCLKALIDSTDGLDADGICRATGYAWSGTLSNALGALRTAGLLIGKNTEVMRASAMLFDEAA